MKKKEYKTPSTETFETGTMTLFASSATLGRGRYDDSDTSDDPTADDEGYIWAD